MPHVKNFARLAILPALALILLASERLPGTGPRTWTRRAGRG